jgi:hypothetical protein
MKPFVKPTEKQILRWIESNVDHYKVRNSKKRGAIYLINNPDIPGDSGFHLGISPSQGWVKDFRPHYANYNGTFLSYVAKIRNFSFNDAIKEVCGNDSNLKILMREALRSLKDKEKEEVYKEPEIIIEERFRMPPEMLPISNSKKKMAWNSATNYLTSRMVSQEEAERYNVHYSSTALAFPYIEYDHMVYWQARDLLNKTFMFPEADPEGKSAEDFLYGFDNIEPRTPIILVEAIFCKLVISDNTLATGGAALHEKQFRRLRALMPSEIILAPDNDEAGILSLKNNFDMLSQLFSGNLYYCLPPKKCKDWNEVAKKINRLKHKDALINYINKNKKLLTRAEVNKLTIPIMRAAHTSKSSIRRRDQYGIGKVE